MEKHRANTANGEPDRPGQSIDQSGLTFASLQAVGLELRHRFGKEHYPCPSEVPHCSKRSVANCEAVMACIIHFFRYVTIKHKTSGILRPSRLRTWWLSGLCNLVQNKS